MLFTRRVDGSPLLRALPRAAAGLSVAAVMLARPAAAHASLLSPELEDKLANVLALFVLFVIPVVLIALFWMVHVLPEKIAHQRHHPQFEAIRTLCLLSLVFGGLLWPIAWVWAYSKPVMYKMAYGTDLASHEVDEEGSGWDERKALAPAAPLGLHERLARLEKRGVPEAELTGLRADLDALEAKFAGEGR
jgi:CBS domain containing-hemolysin-like protein